MDAFRLDRFQDGSLIADLVADTGAVAISLVGLARYEIAVVCDSGRQLTVLLWTTAKGSVTTRMQDGGEWAVARLGSDGNLQTLIASACSLHLEHMDRGSYSLVLEHVSGDTMHLDFSTTGYLKTKVLTHVAPGSAN
jgi:hypothetical protein